MKHKNLKKRFLDISIVLITLTAILCIIMAVRSYYEYKKGSDAYLAAADSFLSSESSGADTVIVQDSEIKPDNEQTTVTENIPEKTEVPTGSTETATKTETAAQIQSAGRISVNFGALKAVNSNISAWIISEGTMISYPIAASESEEDYSYYISHLFNGTKNKLGTLFTDARNLPFKENNTIIYGHNMLNGTMFSSLLNYRKQSYYDSHPVMRLYTPEGNYKILIFSGYMTTTLSDVYILNLTGDAFADYIAKAAADSDFKTEVSVDTGDRIITLSTCDNQTSEKRYVIHGVLIPE